MTTNNKERYKITNNDFFIEAKEFSLRSDTINESERTIDAILVTETKTQMFDYRLVEIVDEIQLMSGAELPAKVVLLDSHHRYDSSYVLGSITNLKVIGKELHGKVHFVKDDVEVDKVWNKVRQGHLNSLSVGFKVKEAVYVNPDTTVIINGAEYTASKNRYLRVDKTWILKEGSVVPIGADPNARFKMDVGSGVGAAAHNRKALEMDDDTVNDKGDGNAPMIQGQSSVAEQVAEPIASQKSVPASAPAMITPEQEAEIVKKHEDRKAHLTALAGDEVPPEVLKSAIDGRMNDDQACALFYKHIQADRPTAVRCSVGTDHAEGHTKMLADAILYGSVSGKKLLSKERQAEVKKYDGIGIVAMTELIMRKNGEDVPFNRVDLYKKAISSLELNESLGDALNRGLAAAYLDEPSTLAQWAGEREVNDFRAQHEIKLGTMKGVQQAHKGQPIEYSSFKDTKESYRLKTGALGFSINRDTFVNDDLGVIPRAIDELSYALKMDLEDKGYALLLSNAALGPVMGEDSKNLFSLTHAQPNLLEGTPGSVFSQTGLDAANLQFAKIRRFEGKSASNQQARILLVPKALEAKAMRDTQSSEIHVAEGGGTMNIYKGMYQVIGEARLDAVSATGWYQINKRLPTIVRVFLRGARDPSFRSIDLVTQLGLAWQVWHDYEVGTVDWRGIQLATGVAAA